MTKRALVILMTIVLMMGILATTGNAEAQMNDQLSRILEKGEIIIATEGTWSPWTYHDEENNLVGFDVEVGRLIAEKLGVEATFVEVLWDGIFAGLDAGRYDIVTNGVEVTVERAEKYDFSSPYAFARTVVIVKADNQDIQSLEDLQGRRTANTLSSTYAAVAESYGANPIGVDTLDQSISLVLTGRVDATLNDNVSFFDYMRVQPDAELKIAAAAEDAVQMAIPVRKGEDSARLLEKINEIVSELHAEGALSILAEKYFGSDITKDMWQQ